MSTAPEPTVPVAEPADPSLSSYKDYYAKIDWESRHVQAGQIYPLFEPPLEEGPSKSHGQLYDEIRRTASDMPHCYLMALRDNARIDAFHRVAVFQPPLGSEVEEWHDKIMIFNGDVCRSQMPQPVYMPPQLLQITATTQKVHSWQAYVLHYTEDATANPMAPVASELAPCTCHGWWEGLIGTGSPPSSVLLTGPLTATYGQAPADGPSGLAALASDWRRASARSQPGSNGAGYDDCTYPLGLTSDGSSEQ
jgi:hypothetical protein